MFDDTAILQFTRDALTYGADWALYGPLIHSALGVSKLVADVVDPDWNGCLRKWVRPRTDVALAALVAEGWAGTSRGQYERGINGDDFWRVQPLSRAEWLKVAQLDYNCFPWNFAVLGRDRPGPFYPRLGICHEWSPVPPLVRRVSLMFGPVPLDALLVRAAEQMQAEHGGETRDVHDFVRAAVTGMLRRGAQGLRCRGELVYVVPPMRSRMHSGRSGWHEDPRAKGLALPPRSPLQLTLW